MSTPRKPDPLSDLPAGQSADQVGMYHWDIRAAKWTWSSEIHLMYGYQPGSVEPGLDLVTKHGHPTDRRQLAEVFDEARRTGQPFSAQQRILAADESTRAVVVVGDVEEEDGEVVGVHGYYVDLTTSRIREAEQLSELAGEAAGLQRAMASRATIEQAKGMIMLAYGHDSAGAFELLIRVSQQSNVKLRDLADRLVEAVHASGQPPAQARAHLETILARLSAAEDV
ncbi:MULTISPECIES: PAS and ANTAR domain-containing protein [Amycolatopsis]|uniref:PAS domain-containing protein n=1 Tax=Amycolatopsis thermoflava TaxID=84480 RepID=A0A3N2H4R2_9PSEU|nr:PAS and ANTAR domain-containing protein [Amycolatopsis thermoflava]ROS43095.1 PAS domain-containing protein [Amycolatopsis thermoflava]